MVEDRRYIVCVNEKQVKKDAADREAIVASLRNQLKQGDKALVGNRSYRKYLKAQGMHFTTTSTSSSPRRVLMGNGCCVPTRNCPRKKWRSSTSRFGKSNRCSATLPVVARYATDLPPVRPNDSRPCILFLPGADPAQGLARTSGSGWPQLRRQADVASATSMLCSWSRSPIKTSASTSEHKSEAPVMQCSAPLASRSRKPSASFRRPPRLPKSFLPSSSRAWRHARLVRS